jgi:hypothetical protein
MIREETQVQVENFDTAELEEALNGFRVGEPTSPNEVCVGVALDPIDIVGRLEVVNDRYKHQGYLEEVGCMEMSDCDLLLAIQRDGEELFRSLIPEGRVEEFETHGLRVVTEYGEFYIDKYHWRSIQIVAKSINQEGDLVFLASSRIVLPDGSETGGLPTHDDPSLSIFPNGELEKVGLSMDDINAASVEFSQYARRRGLKGNHMFSALGVLRASFLLSKRLGIKSWIASIDDRVISLLNGTYFRFQLPKVGDTAYYLGSPSTPVLVEMQKALDNASDGDNATEQSRFSSGFIQGQFGDMGWYIGQ